MLPVLPLSSCGHSDEVEILPLTESGEVYSWTRAHVGTPPGGTLMAMADFFDGALRVTAPVLDAEEIDIGDRVVVVPGEDTPYALRRV